MEISYIVFAGIIVCGISALPLVLSGVRKLFAMFLKVKEHEEEKQHQQKIENAKDELKEVLDSGDLSDLINVANKLGNKQKKGGQR